MIGIGASLLAPSLVKAQGVLYQSHPAALLLSKLPHWFYGSPSGKTVLFSGDSTTSNALELFAYLAAYGTSPYGSIPGATCINYGSNGASLNSFLTNGIAFGITNAIAQAANLYVLCWGINDVRLGATDLPTLTGYIVSMVNQMRAALPTSDFVLWGSNSFLTTDPDMTMLVQPETPQAAQAYTTEIYQAYANAYAANASSWPNVGLVQKQDGVFGTVCQPTSIYMLNQLHPNNLGQDSEGAQILNNIGYGPWH